MKNEIYNLIETHLKNNHIRYVQSNSDSKGCLYELFLGSMNGFIQVELDFDDLTDDYVYLQLFSPLDSQSNALYENDWASDGEHQDSLEGVIDTLIEEVKKLNSVIAKISIKIDQIKEICLEYDMDYEQFITIEYEF
jgi:hypothetical protein